MNENPTNTKIGKKAEAAIFDHEKLDVYHLELKFIEWVTPLLEEVSRNTSARTAEVRDQLDRASLSALLNTAEGNGKRQRQVRARFFDDARGSATECAACLDALVAKQAATEERVAEGKKTLLRIVSMLCGLIDRFDGLTAFREEPGEDASGKPEVERKVNYCSKVSRRRTSTRTSRI
jgi:four helix bundle protein